RIGLTGGYTSREVALRVVNSGVIRPDCGPAVVYPDPCDVPQRRRRSSRKPYSRGTSAEGVGFEPTMTLPRHSGFQDRRHRPLGEPSWYDEVTANPQVNGHVQECHGCGRRPPTSARQRWRQQRRVRAIVPPLPAMAVWGTG